MTRRFAFGFVAGVVAAMGLAAGISYANSLEKKVNAGACRVSVGFGRMTGGTECYSNRVMVGIRGNYILCADVEVVCN